MALSTSAIQLRGHLNSSRHVTLGETSETRKSKSVRGDRLRFQRTLVDLILNAQATGGEPPLSTMAIFINVVYQPWCIQYPQLEPVQTYELKSGLIHLLPKFHGLAGEDPHKHLKEFHVVCSTMWLQGILEDYIKMKAFPISLDGAAKD
ncbi:hypothetical protein CR513_55883, partial [Mucuna pruriens]